ncbi:MAG TPA: ATP-binding protein [Syntrophales bacterium]|nr:ATP-binding protein [Syntrophales bacterium]
MQTYIPRKLEHDLKQSLNSSPVTALLGPRQCGKSTLARHIIESLEKTIYLDLEKPSDMRKLDDPEFFFSAQQNKLVCIDEIQRVPDIFPIIRSSVDENRKPQRFLILGSASQELVKTSSETLAGRIHYLELTPFTYNELFSYGKKFGNYMFQWVRGGFPDSILAPTEERSFTWRQDFIRTFLERDIPQFGLSIPAITMRRQWTMLAHYHGNIFNASKLGQSLGITHPTVRKYLDVLEQTFMVRVLQPLEANLKKRLIKSPKVYIRDSGILHALLEIEDSADLLGHPVAGSSWEGWCIEQIITALPRWRASYYRTSSGEEIDLIMERKQKRLAFEFKASMSPEVTKGFAGTLKTLKPIKTWIVAPVAESYPIPQGAIVANIKNVLEELAEYA